MKKYLQLCIEVEETVARIYRQLARSSSLPDEVRTALHDLAADEDDHAMQLRFALRFPAGTVVIDRVHDLEPAKLLLERAKNLLVRAGQQLNTRQALEMGEELEQEFCQAHLANSAEFRDESLKKMFAALAQDDSRHRQKLLDLKARFS